MLPRRHSIFILFLGLLLVFALYGSTIYFDFFIFDDSALVYNNALIRYPRLADILKYWSISNTPIIYNAWQIVSMIFGVEDATVFRVVNIFFHGINGFLVVLLCHKIIALIENSKNKNQTNASDPSYLYAAALGGIFFIFHPVQVESVVWISSFKEVLAATFGLLSFLCFLQTSQTRKILFEVGTVAFFLLGLLTHPTIAALPFVYIWLDLTVFKKELKEVINKNIAYLLLLIVAVVLHKTVNPQVASSEEHPIYVRVAASLSSMLEYLQMIFIPYDYSFDYMLTPESISRLAVDNVTTKFKSLLAVATLWSLFYFAKRRICNYLYYPLTLIILLVSVNLGLIGYSFQNISLVSDRFLYFPSIGFSLLVALVYVHISKKQVKEKTRQMTMSGLAICLLVFVGATIYRTTLWKSSGTLLSHSIKSGYDSYPLNMSLGTALAANKEYDAALEHFEKAYAFTLQVDRNGKKLLLADGSEAFAHMFRIHSERKDVEKGAALYKRLEESTVSATPELAWTVAQFFVSVGRWYEAGEVISVVSPFYQQSEQITKLLQMIRLERLNSIIRSHIDMAILSMETKNFDLSKKHLETAQFIRKNLKADVKDIEKLFVRLEKARKSGSARKIK